MILEQRLSKGTCRAIDRGSKESPNGLSADSSRHDLQQTGKVQNHNTMFRADSRERKKVRSANSHNLLDENGSSEAHADRVTHAAKSIRNGRG